MDSEGAEMQMSAAARLIADDVISPDEFQMEQDARQTQEEEQWNTFHVFLLRH